MHWESDRRLAEQNLMYIKSQSKVFTNKTRQLFQSAFMQPVVAGLTDDDMAMVANYYESVQKQLGTEEQTGIERGDPIYFVLLQMSTLAFCWRTGFLLLSIR